MLVQKLIGPCYTFIVSLLLAASLSVNVLQHRALISAREASTTRTTDTLSPGDRVPALRARDLFGNAVEVDYARRQIPVVLYVFRPSCGWCQKNAVAFRELVKSAGRKYSFIGLTLSSEGLEQYLAQYPPGVPIYKDVSPALAPYRLGSTPQTIVILKDGLVSKVWTGAFAGDNRREIEEYFSLRLPPFDADHGVALDESRRPG